MIKSGKSVAVTGATGFLGQRLLPVLVNAGYQVKALTRRDQPATDGVQWVKGNLGTEDALFDLCTRCTAVVHAAGAIKATNRGAFFKANAVGTLNVASAAQKANVSKFLYVSSLAAREPELSHYSASKAAGEDILSQRDWSFDWATMRPPGIYGPGDMETLELIKMIKKGFMLVPGSRDNRASWIHVDDLVKAIVILIGNFPSGEVFDISDGVAGGYSHEQFAMVIGHILGVSPNLITTPGLLIKALGALSGLYARLIGQATIFTYPKSKELLHTDWSAQSTKPNALKTWHPRYTLTTGMENTVDWYRQNGFL